MGRASRCNIAFDNSLLFEGCTCRGWALATYPAQAWLWGLQVIKYAAELATGQTSYNGKNKARAFLMVYLTEELFESVCAIGGAYLPSKRNVAYNFHLELINPGSLQRKWTAFVSPARNLQRHTGSGILGENIAPICALQFAPPHQKLLKSAAKWARINNCIYTKYPLWQYRDRVLRAKARRKQRCTRYDQFLSQ